MLSANKIMFSQGLGLLSIPSNLFDQFNKLLSVYYNSEDLNEKKELLSFLYENCIFGINY